ncbi:MAG: peptidylprolyl isomerase [Acidobacteriota bacterium]|nr:peptidylprolyl isomerase [Acidobacteriota bacterium]
MKIVHLLPGLFLALALTSGQAPPAAPKPAAAAASPVPSVAASAVSSADPIVLTIGTEKITKSQFEEIFAQIVEQMPAERRAAAQGPQAKRQLAEQLAELKVLAQEARREKLDQTPEAKSQLAMRSDQLVAGLLFQKISRDAKPSAADLQAYYDGHKADYDTVSARHILIRMAGSAVPLKEGEKDLSEEEALAKAKDIRAKLVAGGDFAALAKSDSDDAGSGANGGVLGDFTRGRMVPQFEEAAFALKINEISEPVKTQFGYHIIQVTKHESKSMEDAKAEITEKIAPEMAQKGVDAIKSKTTITFDQNYFGK